MTAAAVAAAAAERPEPDRWRALADEALALIGIEGCRVVGHLEPAGGRTIVRRADGRVAGWVDGDGTIDTSGRRVRFEPAPEVLLRARRVRRPD
jgi:hypothetical protein